MAAEKQTGHVSEDALGLHALGDLAILRQSEVEDHLANCGSCRNDLRRLAEAIAVFRSEARAAGA